MSVKDLKLSFSTVYVYFRYITLQKTEFRVNLNMTQIKIYSIYIYFCFRI